MNSIRFRRYQSIRSKNNFYLLQGKKICQTFNSKVPKRNQFQFHEVINERQNWNQSSVQLGFETSSLDAHNLLAGVFIRFFFLIRKSMNKQFYGCFSQKKRMVSDFTFNRDDRYDWMLRLSARVVSCVNQFEYAILSLRFSWGSINKHFMWENYIVFNCSQRKKKNVIKIKYNSRFWRYFHPKK